MSQTYAIANFPRGCETPHVVIGQSDWQCGDVGDIADTVRRYIDHHGRGLYRVELHRVTWDGDRAVAAESLGSVWYDAADDEADDIAAEVAALADA